MKTPSIFICVVLFACSQGDETICTNKYVNTQFGVTIFYSDNWNPYEFYGNSIGLEYQGTDNFERRYDAEIIIKFFGAGMGEKMFYDLFANSGEIKKGMAESLGGTLESETFDKGINKFAGKKWRTLSIEEKGSIDGESYVSTQTNYLWYSPSRPIAITTTVKGADDIKNLDEETECILSKLVFEDLENSKQKIAVYNPE